MLDRQPAGLHGHPEAEVRVALSERSHAVTCAAHLH